MADLIKHADAQGNKIVNDLRPFLEEVQLHYSGVGENVNDAFSGLSEAVSLISEFSGLYEYIPLALFSTSPDGTITRISNVKTELLGITLQDVSSQNITSILQSAPQEHFEKYIDNAFDADGLHICDVTLGRPDGIIIPASIIAITVKTISGKNIFCHLLLHCVEHSSFDSSKLNDISLMGILENRNEGICITDADNRILYVNSKLKETLGYSDSEILGEQLSIMLHDRYKDAFKEYLDTGVRLYNIGLLRKDSVNIEAIAKMSRINGFTAHQLGVYVSIVFTSKTSVRKAGIKNGSPHGPAEHGQAARKNNTLQYDLFRDYVQTSDLRQENDGEIPCSLYTWEYDVQYDTILWDKKVQKIFDNEVLNTMTTKEGFINSICVNKRASVDKELQDAVRQKKIFNAEFKLQHDSIKDRTFQNMAIPIFNAKDEVITLKGIFFDVTRNVRIEEAMILNQAILEKNIRHERLIVQVASTLNSTNYFRDVIDELLKRIAEKLPISSVCMWCYLPNYEKVIKIHSYMCPGRTEMDPIDESDVKPMLEVMLEKGHCLSSRKNKQICMLYEKCNACACYIPMITAGEFRGFMGFCSDKEDKVTSEKLIVMKALSDIISSAWERYSKIQALLDTERKSTEVYQLAESTSRLASIGIIAGSITHEINQPLSAMKIMIDSIMYWINNNKGLVPTKFIVMLDKISQSVDRMSDTINHVRLFWKSPNDIEKHKIELNSIIDKSLALVTRQVNTHGIKLKLDLCTDELIVSGNGIYLEQAIINLVINSMHALDKIPGNSKQIEVKTEKGHKNAIINIRDNGPGLKDKTTNIHYSSLHKFIQSNEGMGLGLLTVKRFIDFHGGKLILDNENHSGANFKICLPIANESQ